MPNTDTEFASELLDLRNIDYRNTLAITGLIEVLLEKSLITKEELSQKVRSLHHEATDDIH